MELKISLIFTATLFTLLMRCGAKPASGYIFTCPRSLKTGSINQLQLIRSGNLDAGTIKVKLYYIVGYDGNKTLASKNEYKLPKGKKVTFLNLLVAPINNDDVYKGKIEISGNIGNETINGSDDVRFSTPRNNIIIIQTDKSSYNPGQDVEVRILKVNKNLKPSLRKTDLGDVYVTDPIGNRSFQFDKIPLGKGLHQIQFPLPDEPTLGQWTIHLNTGNDTETTTTFDVMERKPPLKFEVKVQFPPFVLTTESFIPIQVCANYTYGKPVMGQLNFNISLQRYSDEINNSSYDSQFPVLQESNQLDGCYNYTLNVSQIQTDKDFSSRSILVLANVTEHGTDVQFTKTVLQHRTAEPLTLDFNTHLDYYVYFKPGLPYIGKLTVTNPDGTPAGGEPISLCYTVSKQIFLTNSFLRRDIQYCKDFTSNNKGIIKYTIPPQNSDSQSIILVAKSIKYASDPQDILIQPESIEYLKPFYSPSRSFIQLEIPGKSIPCGTNKDFRLIFTSKGNENFKFYYEVVRQGTVLQSGTKKVAFTVEDDVSEEFQNDNRLINHSEKQLYSLPKSSSSCSSESSEDNCTASKEPEYTPLIGEVKIDIEVDYSFSPEFTLLVFYVRNDKETVAASQKFAVEHCFKNKVDFEFSDAVRQPGQNTAVKITASPHSLCGRTAVDKSVTLLDNSNQITIDTVFDLIRAMDTGLDFITNVCYYGNPQPGLPPSSVIIQPPGIFPSDSYADSYASFEVSGLLVISNLFVITRPCSNDGGDGLADSSSSDTAEYETVEYESEYDKSDDGSKEDESVNESEEDESYDESEEDDSPDATSSRLSSVSAINVRDKFPDTWMFDMGMVGANGVYKSNKTLPDTITEWLGNAVCVSPKDGLGISNTATIDGFQLFFISYTLPTSVIRGELFNIVVSIFNYADGALPITVAFDQPQGYQIVNNSIDGDVCLQNGTSQNFQLQLKATTVGKINITVRAEKAQPNDVCGSYAVSNAYARDAITQSLNVEAEGLPADEVQSSLFYPSKVQELIDAHCLRG